MEILEHKNAIDLHWPIREKNNSQTEGKKKKDECESPAIINSANYHYAEDIATWFREA